MSFQPGDRVATPAGNIATVLPPPWKMPFHTLIQVDNGATVWILTELLTLTDAPPACTTCTMYNLLKSFFFFATLRSAASCQLNHTSN